MTEAQKKAIRAVIHELTTLHGLTASDGPGAWKIDTTLLIAELEAAFQEELK